MSDIEEQPISADEPDLTEEEGEAGFDLGVDVAQPRVDPGPESFDIANDIGFGNGPQHS
ncbi:hypothetical protein ACQHIV_26380 [Kribbella sp. GL6]|uniref:hypothetical protein n=1 Tax=Kribbella sp. GL6 TaxID=3419765 RepID=UPI003D01D7FB